MRACSEACAREEHWGNAAKIAERISREDRGLDRIIERVNNEIL